MRISWFIALFMGLPFLGLAQPFSYHTNTLPIASPNVAQIGHFIDNPVNLSSGTVAVSVPIITLSQAGLSLPVSVDYHGGGVRVEQQSTSVGLGWILTAGGVISRTIKGLPDEYQTIYGGTRPSPPTYFDPYENIAPRSAAVEFYFRMLNKQKDGQNDVFAFSIPGYNGHFVIHNGEVHCIPKQDLKITYNNSTNGFGTQTGSTNLNRLFNFTIQTPDGVRYEFGKFGSQEEIDYVYSNATSALVGQLKVPSAWHLVKASTADLKFSFSLSYEEETHSKLLANLKSQTYHHYLNGMGAPISWPHPSGNCERNSISGNSSNTEHHFSRRLVSITSIAYTVNFEYGAIREDLNSSGTSSAKSLSSISLVSNGSNAFCKKFDFQYDYFRTNPNSTQWHEKRLRLLSIQESSCDGSIMIPPWQFGYTTDFVPSFYSTGKDFWGFYNGKESNQSHLMFPSHNPDGENLDLIFPAYPGANRFPDPEYVGVAMLNRFTYPSGGGEEFNYEINDYDIGGEEEGMERYIKRFTNKISDTNQSNKYLYLDSNQLVNLKCRIIAAGKSFHKGLHKVALINLKSDSIFSFEFNSIFEDKEFAFSEIFNSIDPNQLYEVQLESDSLLIFEIHYATSVGFRLGPGLRIVQRTLKTSPSEVVNTINYSYKQMNERSSGILGYNPAFNFNVRDMFIIRRTDPTSSSFGCLYYMDYGIRVRQDESYFPLATFDNRLLYYNRVIESYNTGGNKTVEFYAPSCCPSMSIPGVGYPSIEPHKQLIAGKMQKEMFYNQSGILMSMVEYEWEEQYELIVHDLLPGVFTSYHAYSAYPESLRCPNSFCVATDMYFYKYSPIQTGVALLNSIKTTNYGVSHIISYTYPLNAGTIGVPILPIKESVQNSDGAIIENEFFYTVGHSNSTINQFFNNLNLKHDVWREVVRHNGVVIGGFEKEYGYFDFATGQLQQSVNQFTTFIRLRKSFVIHGFSSANGFERTEKHAIQNYNALGLPATILKPGWLPEALMYNSFGHLTGVTYGQLTKNYFYYGNTGILSREVNERSQPIWYDYDALGRLQKKWALPTAHWTVKSSCATTQTFTYAYNDLGVVGRNKIQTLTNIQPTGANANAAASAQSSVTHIQYVDGLGRIIQNNIKALNSTDKDVVDFIKYDGLGNITEQFKLIQSLHSDGRFVPNFSSGQVKKVFSYESSPGGQLISESDFNWYPVQFQYYANSSGINIDGTLYQPNTLLISQQTDANGVVKKTYNDKLGRELQIDIVRNVSNGEIAMTRFIYNTRNQVIKVIPPGANSSDADLIFLYEYDSKGRKTRTKIPGKAWEEYTYHPLKEELILTVSNNRLTSKGVWYVFKYDDYGNVIQEGECPLNTFGSNGTPLSPVFSLVHASRTYGTAQHNKNLLTQESRLILESQGPDYIVTSYSYDNHGRVISETSNTTLSLLDPTSRSLQYSYDWQSRLTGTLSNLNLGQGAFTLKKMQAYDEKGNPTTYQLSLNGQPVSEVSNSFNFRNELVSTALGSNGFSQLQKLDFAYTNQGWLRSLNDNEVLPIAESFNRMGDNSSILDLCPSDNQTLTFLPTSTINAENDLFHYRLSYDVRNTALGTGQQEKTGNISQVMWQVKGRPSQFYNYNYDFLSRLTLASYGEVLRMDKNQNPVYHNSNVFNEQLTYDSRGNILRLQRWGLQFTEEGNCFESQKIDDLFYTYTTRTNQLNAINDQTGQVQGWSDFAGVGQSANYQYNADGDLIYDPYKGIGIDFNSKGLAFNISSSLSGGNIRMEYDASGKMQIKETIENGTQLKEFYIDDYVFESIDGGDVHFKELYFEYGRVSENPTKEGYIAHYKLTDHLGNTRIVFADLDGNGKIEQNGTQNEVLFEEHYYPFGMSFGNVLWRTPEGKSFKPNFNGKEKVTALNLQQLLFGARNYDPAVGRWWSVDLLAMLAPDKTPYHFVSNNPINRIDPLGLTDYIVNGKTRTINDGHHDVSIKVSERQFNRLHRKFDRGGSGYERMMNRMSVQNGFTTFGTFGEAYTDASGTHYLKGVSITAHKAGGDSYADWSKNKSLDNIGQVNDVVDNIGGSLGANTGLTRLGSNGKLYFETPNGGVFRGNQYVSSTSIAKYGSKIGRVTGPVGYAISAGQIGYGVYRDGGQFGYNAQVATGGVAGGMVGAWAGAEVGAYSGAAIGGAIGVWFFGVGTAPGAAIGGVVGGIVGGITGGYYGGELGEQIVK